MSQTSIFQGPNRKIVKLDEATAYMLHNTVIVLAYNDGRIKLHSGGWMTQTTKMAMNQISNQFNLGFNVYSLKGEWFVTKGGYTSAFVDGLILSQCEFENKENQACTG